MSLESSNKNGSKSSSSSGNPGGSTSSSSLYPSANSIYSTPGKLLSVNPAGVSTSTSAPLLVLQVNYYLATLLIKALMLVRDKLHI